MLHPFIKIPVFIVQAPPTQVWGKPAPLTPISAKPEIPNEEDNKRLFGIELAKSNKPFEAATIVFPDAVKIALWVSQNWLADPVVHAARDLYVENFKLSTPILDKEQLAAKVLFEAEAAEEGKDKAAFYKLYSDIAGYTGKVNVDASTKTYVHNEMKVKLVRASDKSEKEIETSPIIDNEQVVNPVPIKLKLVKV